MGTNKIVQALHMTIIDESSETQISQDNANQKFFLATIIQAAA